MKVSIIVPIYNVEPYLDRCVRSLVEQTHRDLEIILVDDGSPDHCPAMCDEWARRDNRIRVIHKQNAGQGLARNDALDIATGDYLCFVDGDDFLDVEAMACWLDATEGGKHDVVCAAFYESWTPETGGHVSYAVEGTWQGPEQVADTLADAIASAWELHEPARRFMGVCGGIIRHQIIRDHHLRFHSEREVLAEDLLFLCDLFPHIHSVRNIPRPLYYYCLNMASTSHTFKEPQIDATEKLATLLRQTPLAVGNEEFGRRIAKLLIYKYGCMQSQILLSDLPFSEKRRLSRRIYAKPFWRDIAAQYPVAQLPHMYQYYFGIFLHGRFLTALIRQRLYGLRKRLLRGH